MSLSTQSFLIETVTMSGFKPTHNFLIERVSMTSYTPHPSGVHKEWTRDTTSRLTRLTENVLIQTME